MSTIVFAGTALVSVRVVGWFGWSGHSVAWIVASGWSRTALISRPTIIVLGVVAICSWPSRYIVHSIAYIVLGNSWIRSSWCASVITSGFATASRRSTRLDITASPPSPSSKSSSIRSRVHATARKPKHLGRRERCREAARSRKETGKPTGSRNAHAHHASHHCRIHSRWHSHHVGRHTHHIHPAHIATCADAIVVELVLSHHTLLWCEVAVAVVLFVVRLALLHALFRLEYLYGHAGCRVLASRLRRLSRLL